ncbi:MAG: hypothetical protein J6C55_03000 [Oscillospiraceae bacterium]|nr:hypothetical protein [Oscillospiraceae bacterium]
MDILKKSAYIKGLMEGLNVDDSTNEGKILCKVVELLDGICEEICDVREDIESVWEVVDEIDEDLRSLEQDVFDDCDDDCDCGFSDFFCVRCPKCGKEHYVRYSDLTEKELEEGKIKCPECKVEIDIDECLVSDDELDGCDCGCGKVGCDCDDGNCNCDK